MYCSQYSTGNKESLSRINKSGKNNMLLDSSKNFDQLDKP